LLSVLTAHWTYSEGERHLLTIGGAKEPADAEHPADHQQRPHLEPGRQLREPGVDERRPQQLAAPPSTSHPMRAA
jgi:hypothetical protein